MKTIGIIPNMDKDKGLHKTRKILDYIQSQNCSPLLLNQVAHRMDVVGLGVDMDRMCSEADFIIALGGDGTMLSVARRAAIHDTPVLGINLGFLGFLTDVEEAEATVAIAKAIGGVYKLEKRIMLEAVVLNQTSLPETSLALNEVCVSRGIFSRVISFSVYVNDEYIDTYKADGIICSTPTGSTAYNLSSGGPILKPDTEMVAITPICPHNLHARSVVVAARDEIKLKINDVSGDILMSLDGQSGTPLKPGDEVLVRQSGYYTSIIKTNQLSFYEILRKKML